MAVFCAPPLVEGHPLGPTRWSLGGSTPSEVPREGPWDPDPKAVFCSFVLFALAPASTYTGFRTLNLGVQCI